MRGRSLLLLLVLAGLGVAPARGGDHVRVVLDLSRSMDRNDHDHIAQLATALLLDLANPNTTRGDDSFRVYPFDRAWSWPSPDASPPSQGRSALTFDSRHRQDFVRELLDLPYDAAMTYFLPGLEAALADLEKTGGPADRKVIVLVTDGVPERRTREREAELLRARVSPRLEGLGGRLYVLAFGKEAADNRSFFDALVRGRSGTDLGAVFIDPEGRDLLRHMASLFGRSFGYTPDSPLSLPGVSSLNLHGGSEPARVAVVVTAPGAGVAPSLQLSPPAGGMVNAPEGLRQAQQRGARYTLQWVLSPDQGHYGLVTNASVGSVAVLRPSELTLSILPAPPHTQTARTVAKTRFPLKVLVQSKAGAGDPGPVQVFFRTAGERAAQEPPFAWVGKLTAPPAGPGTATSSGRVYDIVVEFPEHKEDPRRLYPGHLEVTARRGEAVVGSLERDHAHRIEVYPFLSLAPLPSSANARDTALQRHERGCTSFQVTLEGGELPHPDRPRYPLRATLDESVELEKELRGASFTFDGLPLEIAKKPAPEPGVWYRGRELSREQLLGRHELCIQLGKPTQGDPALPLALPLHLTLLEVPYDDFEVVAPFTLKVMVAPPGCWQRWGEWLLLSAALLTIFALVWYLRARPDFPPDLGFALVPDGAAVPLSYRPLPEAGLARRLLGLVAERRLQEVGRDRTLGWLRPVNEELYQLRPVRGVHVEAADTAAAVPIEGRLATLAVHRTYRLRSRHGSYLLRVEFR